MRDEYSITIVSNYYTIRNIDSLLREKISQKEIQRAITNLYNDSNTFNSVDVLNYITFPNNFNRYLNSEQNKVIGFTDI